MTMQRKHYNAIAAALRSGQANEKLICDIASRLYISNNKFNIDLFYAKAMTGPTMEQRAAKYRTQIRRLDAWHKEMQS